MGEQSDDGQTARETGQVMQDQMSHFERQVDYE